MHHPTWKKDLLSSVVIFIAGALLLSLSLVSSGCTTTNAQKGAVVGGLGGMAGSALGKGDRKTTAITGAAGAALGYVIGNEIDKKTPTQDPTQQAPMSASQPRTDCTKVIVRTTKNGQTVETVEERCEAVKTTTTY
jgi:outer membrane lipoprotein SlyB